MDQHATYADVSDEELNSFVDGQFADDERQEMLAILERNKELADKVCELQRLKHLTKLAYQGLPEAAAGGFPVKAEKWPRLAAAAAIFAFGLVLGLTGLNYQTSNTASLHAAQSAQSSTRVLVHLTSSNSENGLSTLTNLEQMLEDYRHSGREVQVEVIANGHGINLLRQGMTPFGERIERLVNEYDNLSFAACKSTIEQIQLVEGTEIELIPQVKLIDSGVVEVIERQKQGWTYIRG